RRKSEADGLLLPRIERDSLEATQLLDRRRHGGETFTNVELNGFHSRALAGVFNIHTHTSVSLCIDLRRVEVQVAILKLRVAQSVAKRIQRRARHVDIASGVTPATVDPVRFR